MNEFLSRDARVNEIHLAWSQSWEGTMDVITSFPVVDEILISFSASIGDDLPGYRNHVFRGLNYFAALSTPTIAVPDVVLIASAFHDIGIWTDRTFDYLEPSVRQAKTYLVARNLEHLEREVEMLINDHHKLRPAEQTFSTHIEAFRQADLIDVSLGLVRFGLSALFVRSVKATFPNAGFHRRLATLTAKQFLRSPLHPLPMIHW